MPAQARSVFWSRTKTLTVLLLALWLLVNLLVPWFARDMHPQHALGFPIGYWMAAEGTLLIYLLIVVAYVWWMDRLEARYLHDAVREAESSSDRLPPP